MTQTTLAVPTKTLSVQEVADKLTKLVGSGQFEEAQNSLFAQDVVSIDLPDAKGKAAEFRGLPSIIERTHQFQAAVASVEGLKISKPIIQGNAIAIEFELDFTAKNGGKQRLVEIIVYVVKDGKVFHEQFFA